MTTATATTIVYTLDKNQIKALRTADSICLDHNAIRPDACGIRAIKRGPGPWHLEETINVPTRSSVTISGDFLDYDTRNGAHATCFAMLYSAKYNEEWQTITSLLRAGDELELRWVGSDNNGYLNRSTVTDEEKGIFKSSPGLGQKLCHDKLYVHIRRDGKRKYSFYLEDSICPNNSARMVRPNGGN